MAVGEYNLLEETVAELSTSFEAFFEEHRDRLFGLLVLVTGNRAEAEELAQDAFLALWERWDRVSTMEDPAGYLNRTAINLFRKRYRRAAILRRVTTYLPARGEAGAADANLMLSEALRTLSPRQRAALVLTELLGYTAEEAARILGVKASTIGALKFQGRAALRKTTETRDE